VRTATALLPIVAVLLPIAALLLPTAASASIDDLDWTGDVRLRLRYVDSAEPGHIVGTYGELLTRGFNYRNRFALEVAYPVTGRISVGGKLRVSNEGEIVLRTGPEYLSSEFGSVFAAYETPALRSRFGYFDISYSPLTLMRWDLNDDPEGGGGGCAVCPGSPGVAGTIVGESLEELGPTLTFEGVWAEATPWDIVGGSGFYTKSDIATVAGEDIETTPVMTYGAKLDLKHYLTRVSSLIEASALVVRSEEDAESDLLGGGSTQKLFDNTVYGLVWEVPVARGLSFGGEWNQTITNNKAGAAPELEGYGGIFSLIAETSGDRKFRFDGAYIYLSPNWDSFFRALSYNANRRGVRLRLEYSEGRFLVALFAKYLSSIDPGFDPAGADSSILAYPTFSLRGYFNINEDLTLGLTGIYSGEGAEKDGFTLKTDNRRITYLGTLSYEFGRGARLNLEERYIQHEFALEDDYNVSMLSLYLRASIW
jgi:hypothetical protein